MYGVNYLILSLVFVSGIVLAWFAIKVCLKIQSVIKNFVSENYNIQRLLCDIRDGTKSFYIERRKFFRVRVKDEAITAILRSGPSIRPMKILNISYGNALLRTNHHFQPGQIVDLDIRLALFPQPIKSSARIIRTTPIPNAYGIDPIFDVGVEFLNMSAIDNDKLIETVSILLKSRHDIVDDECPPSEGEDKSREYYYLLEKRYFNHTLRTLIYFIDSNDKFTYAHSKNVVKYSLCIARSLGLDRYETLKIKIAALLHDIGKYKVEKSILEKNGPLTPEEWEKVKRHPDISASIITETGIFKEIAEIVKHHHSQYAGGGYPEPDKKGDDIPLGARILSVADSYDAMTSERPYRKKPMTHQEAIEELKRCAGKQFDPQIVDAFLKNR